MSKQQNKELKTKSRKKLPLLVAAALIVSLLLPAVATATPLTQAGVRLGRLGISASTGNDLLVTFKLNNAPTTVDRILVTLPSGFTVTTGSPAVGSTFPNTPASITAPPGLPATATATGAGAGLGGTIVVSGLTSASLNNTSLYGFTIASGTVTNPSTAGQYNISVASRTSTPTTVDSTTTPTYIYGASSNQDQVVVSASVAPNFSFSLSANTDTVPQIDPSTTQQTSTGVTMTVGTNSPLGYTAYVKSANAALNSATSPGTPIVNGTFNGAPDTHAAGTTKYGFVPSTGTACTTCTGSIAYDPEYTLGANQSGAFNSTNFASFVSRNGYTNADAITLQERVSVANTIGYANDYTDTLTIVAAGNF